MAGTPSVPGGTGGGAPINSGTPTPSSGGPAWKNQAKNVGVEETDPRRPHFVVTEKISGAGAGD